MKVAIVKPDFHAQGGFEIVVGRIAAGLRERGHQVDLVQVDILFARRDSSLRPASIEFAWHKG